MKISASIYSDKKRPIKEVIKDLVDHQVDLLHVDCNDDLTVFDDIQLIREICDIPIDLHIISDNPTKFYAKLIEHPVEYLTFQHENLISPLQIPNKISGKKGIAIITPTPVEIFERYKNFDFILIMATIPGQSGGKFDEINFEKIRQFRKIYPSKSIHVDGGVNPEVSFILRNMGVTSAVSGSYLFKSSSIGNALMNLTKRTIESSYQVSNFMIPLSESPIVKENELSFKTVLNSIDQGNHGFCLIIGLDNELRGIISNADIRKELLNCVDDLTSFNVEKCINRTPLCIQESNSVIEMLQIIKRSKFPILYLPVINKNEAKGIVTFINLNKGEL